MSIFTTGSGAPAPLAMASALRRMPSRSCLRVPSLVLRTVSWSLTSSGMMLCLVPPWIEPTVTTAGSVGLTSRLTSVCRSRTSLAAMTTGSMVVCGWAPWPPLPRSVTSTLSTLASAGPSRDASVPWASCESQCSARQ
jgi:hypothetical protein